MEDIFKIKEGKVLIAILILGGFITMLNETSLSITYPNLMLEFGITEVLVQWLTTIYVLVSGIVFLITAHLIKKYPIKKLFLSSMALLIVGSILSIFSYTFEILMLGRIIQAIGTGIIVPLVFNSVLFLTLPQKRGFMMGIVSLVIFSAPIFSPVIMGFIMQIADWRLFFVIVLIMFLISTILGYKKLFNFTETQESKLDILSVILAAIGCSLIVYAFSCLSEKSLITIIGLIVIGIIVIGLFINRQRHISNPLIKVHILKDYLFVIGVLTNLINVMVIFGLVVVMPMYLESGLGTTSLVASLLMFPGTIINCILPLLSGHLYDKHGPKVVICSGMGIMAVGLFLLTNLSLTTSFITIILIVFVVYFGSGFALSPNQTNTLGNLKKEEYASGSAIMTSSQQIGGAVGSSLFISLMVIGKQNYLSSIVNPTETDQLIGLVSGVNFSFTIATIFIVIIFILTFLLKQKADYNQ